METQYKLAARSAQLLAKEVPQDEATRVMATMATAKSQLSKASAASSGGAKPLISVNFLMGPSVGERTMPDLCAGVPRPAPAAGGNGEARHSFLPRLGASQSHHCCCQRSGDTKSEPAETKVAGENISLLTSYVSNERRSHLCHSLDLFIQSKRFWGTSLRGTSRHVIQLDKS